MNFYNTKNWYVVGQSVTTFFVLNKSYKLYVYTINIYQTVKNALEHNQVVNSLNMYAHKFSSSFLTATMNVRYHSLDPMCR